MKRGSSGDKLRPDPSPEPQRPPRSGRAELQFSQAVQQHRPTGLRFVSSLFLLIWIASFVVPCAAQTAFSTPVSADSASGSVGPDTFYVVLEEEGIASVALAAQGARKPVGLAATRSRLAQIRQRQAALRSQLTAAGYEVIGRYSRLANALKVRVPPGKAAALRQFAGVKRVEPVRLYHRATSTSVPFIGTPSVWTSAGVDGAGIRIGLIDTGIDYTHADFGGSGDPAEYSANDPTVIEHGSFPTAKVIGGFDFAGNSYNAASSDSIASTPFPDPDPLDCHGHGTHVAGIAAGFGVLTNGLTYVGSYATNLDLKRFNVGPGVAPKALLYALKVFGCDGPTDLVLEALEWAADPNDDGDFSDRLDVVNLSLGSSFGTISPDDVVLNAANRLAELGCVVVVAAGNSGNIFYTTGAPGVAERAISVADSIDAGLSRSAIEVVAPFRIRGLYEAVEGAFTKPLSETGPITGSVVLAEPSRACEPLTNAASLSGRIALMDRGICLFVDKVQRAQDAGALAVIMVNNVEGPPIIMAGTNAGINIPAVMISRSDGELLKQNLANLRVRLDASLVLPGSDLADQLADSSSRGPSSPRSVLKPEIAAPGLSILSAEKGSGNKGVVFSGTSMSAPHVAGAAALLKQLHPNWPVEEIKAALMNTAAPTKDENGQPYPESRTGAGRVQVDAAAKAQVTAAAENASGLVSLSFGNLVLTNAVTQIRRVRLTNHGTNTVTFTVSITETVTENGFTLEPLTNVVAVSPDSSVSFPFRLSANPQRFDRIGDDTTPTRLNGQPRHTLFEASGNIHFQTAGQSLHLPYYAILTAGSDYSATATHLDFAGSGATATLTIPIQGASAHAAPLVSAFQLGAHSPNQKLTDPIFAAADLLAVGAATDSAAQRSIENATLYFGIATAESWTTPQSFLIDLEVLIDTNRDGVIDYVLINGNDGGLAAKDLLDPEVANDVFLTVVRNVSTGELTSGGFINVFSANQRDTAPFNNNVLVMSVPNRTLGISAANSKFNYRVIARGADSEKLIDQTAWILFDAARPAVDTARYGIQGYPMHTDGQPLKVEVNRPAAIAGGFGGAKPLEVLLLHHFNPPNRRMEIVRVNFAGSDTDSDGMPDDWEREQFGGLAAATRSSDFDRDGFSDRDEFTAGTDPKDAKSLLKILSVTTTNGTQRVVRWSSVADRFYSVQRSTNVAAPFLNVRAGIPATPPVNTFVDTNAPPTGPLYYRVRLD